MGGASTIPDRSRWIQAGRRSTSPRRSRHHDDPTPNRAGRPGRTEGAHSSGDHQFSSTRYRGRLPYTCCPASLSPPSFTAPRPGSCGPVSRPSSISSLAARSPLFSPFSRGSSELCLDFSRLRYLVNGIEGSGLVPGRIRRFVSELTIRPFDAHDSRARARHSREGRNSIRLAAFSEVSPASKHFFDSSRMYWRYAFISMAPSTPQSGP